MEIQKKNIMNREEQNRYFETKTEIGKKVKEAKLKISITNS